MASTRFTVRGAPLPETTYGNLNALWQAMLDRLEVISPFGEVQIRIGGLQPTSNQGPWLKGGTQWWVWDETLKTYVPLDISASYVAPFTIASVEPAAPTGTAPKLWLKTLNSEKAAIWYWYNATDAVWVPTQVVVNQGTTAQRPTSPVDLEQYYDTDIDVLIWYERGQWRTVSGTPGDVKFTTAATEADALTANPGWSSLGVTYFGRAPVFAGQGTGLTDRAPGNSFGAETVILTTDQMPVHDHGLSPPFGRGKADGNAANPAGGMVIFDPSFPTGTNTGTSGLGAAHDNNQASIALVGLKKD